jgi:hypothetical protein
MYGYVLSMRSLSSRRDSCSVTTSSEWLVPDYPGHHQGLLANLMQYRAGIDEGIKPRASKKRVFGRSFTPRKEGDICDGRYLPYHRRRAGCGAGSFGGYSKYEGAVHVLYCTDGEGVGSFLHVKCVQYRCGTPNSRRAAGMKVISISKEALTTERLMGVHISGLWIAGSGT